MSADTITNKTASYNIKRVRADFPILNIKVHGKPLVYLDNAATTQKPKQVIDALADYYLTGNSNVHRGVHYLSEQATKAYEGSRGKIQKFINAKESSEIIFVRGTTEGINLIANSFGKVKIKADDEIIISNMEHHSNIVPWQILCSEKEARLKIIPINDAGELLIDEYKKLFTDKTKLVSVVHVSNSLGTINPVKQIIEIAHQHGVPVLLDGAQAVQHLYVDVQELDCDFYTFSGHKIYGPTGIGVLYGKSNLLEVLPPFQGGGDMISSVTFEKTTYNELPYKFEAGTPNIAGAVGLGAAIEYVSKLGIEQIALHEKELVDYATERLSSIEGLRIIGTAKEKTSVVSFVLDKVHPHDIGTVLDFDGLAIRTGHHCTQPVMQRFNVPATARASFGLYNTKDEIDLLYSGIKKVIEVFC